MKLDRTIKFMLAMIVVLLAGMVLRPLVSFENEAYAQDSRTGGSVVVKTPSTNPNMQYRLAEVGTIQLPANKRFQEMQVIDSAQSIVLRFNDSVVVIRVDEFLPPTTKIR